MKTIVAKEVKEEIISKVKAGEPAVSVAEKYGVSPKTIYGWLRWTTTNKVSWMEHIELKKENQVLKEIIEVLTLELQKVKKRTLIKIVQAKVRRASKTLLSNIFNFTRKSLYQNQDSQKIKDLIVKNQILKTLKNNPSYGHRRLALALGVGKKRGRRIMRLYGIKPYKRKTR